MSNVDATQLGVGRDAMRVSRYNAISPIAIFDIQNTGSSAWTKFTAKSAEYAAEPCEAPELSWIADLQGAFSETTRALLEAMSPDATGSFRNPRVNEQYLCHGTSWEGALGIIGGGGFKGHEPTFIGAGAMLVKGNYFAESPEKADQYSRGCDIDKFEQDLMKPGVVPSLTEFKAAMQEWIPSLRSNFNNIQICPMLIARVLLGCPAIVDICTYEKNETIHGARVHEGPFYRPGNSTLVPPFRSALVPPFRSVVLIEGNDNQLSVCRRRFKEFVVYNGEVCLPSHLIIYARVLQ